MSEVHDAVGNVRNAAEQAHGEGEIFDAAPHRPTKRALTVSLAVGGVVFASLLAVGIVPRVFHRAEMLDAERAAAAQTPSVRIARAQRSTSTVGLELPGSMQPLQETTVYARANGYVRSWRVDIGAHVKKGDVLAVLEIPDIDEELRQARAAAAQARAGIDQATTQLALANTTTHRYSTLGQSGVVSQQEVDQYQATFDVQKTNVTASQAAYNSAQANVHRLEDLKSFGTLTSPFDGVVTMRTAEVGQLVVSGAGGQPLYKVAEVDTLRVFINVPQLHAAGIHAGMHAPIRVRELRNRVFDGVVARTSNEIDATNRSLLTEVDIPNPDGVLLAGMYARVKLDVEDSDRPLLVPATAVLFNAQGTRAIVIHDGVVHWKTVEIDGDLGDRLAIARGLAENDAVALMPTEQLVEGMQVRGDEGKAGSLKASADAKASAKQP
jgi:membrane fusion protein, multidrug efflux system